MKFAAAARGIAAMGLIAAPVLAADFPSRPSRIIVPYAPGGATDIIARLLATKLNESWGQPVIVENRAGASGNIALEMAARAAPDGYTLLVGNVSTNAINEVTFSKTLAIKPSRDLPGVTGLVEIPHLWLVHPSITSGNLKEFIEYARKSGGKLTYASAGLGSYVHLDIANFLKANRLQMVHSPYKGGAGQVIPAMISNEAQFTMLNMASTLQHVKAGRIKPLATTWATRRPEVPDVQTVAEAGFPGMGTNAWQGLFAPAGVPRNLVDRIHGSVLKAMDDTAMKENLAKQLMYPKLHKTPAEFARFVDGEIKHWAGVIRDNSITLE